MGIATRSLSAVLLAVAAAACRAEPEELWVETHGPAPSAASAPGAPDVLVVLLDALRPDHLSALGYERETSPFLGRWMEGAATYENAYTHGTQTRIAVASLFSGTLPTVHRVRRVGLSTPQSFRDGETDGFARSLTTWAESLQQAGYETWGLSSNPNVSEVFGFSQGFTRWWQTSDRDGRHVLDKFLAAWGERQAARPDRPLFAYVHFMDPHNPYEPPEPWDEHFDVPRGKRVYENGLVDVSPRDLAYTMAQYDGEIRYLDGLLERLIGAWEAGGGVRPRATLVLSDHGDEFCEHGGMGHGMTVHEELARTLCAFKGPGVEPGRHAEPIAHVDLHRLVLDWAGAPPPAEARGRPRAVWASEPAPLYTESGPGIVGFRRGSATLVFRRDDPDGAVWYERSSDPGEARPRSDPERLAELRRALAELVAADQATAERLETPARQALEEGVLQDLKGLGYAGE